MVHRYTDPIDQQIMAVFSSALAFGNIRSFLPVLHTLSEHMNQQGGPQQWCQKVHYGSTELDHLYYRWTRGRDWVNVAAALGENLERGLQPLFVGHTAKEVIEHGVRALRLRIEAKGQQTRGTSMMLSLPSAGSACKRWNLFLRWMVRPADGVDLGLFSHLHPKILIIPLDTHIHQISTLLSFTKRRSANWKTAEEITRKLRNFSENDPIRYDFALAHLGISGECTASFVSATCSACLLQPFCAAGSKGSG